MTGTSEALPLRDAPHDDDNESVARDNSEVSREKAGSRLPRKEGAWDQGTHEARPGTQALEGRIGMVRMHGRSPYVMVAESKSNGSLTHQTRGSQKGSADLLPA